MMIRRCAGFLLLAVGASVPSEAYYHFIHYLAQGNAPEKFDLNALPNKTVSFFVSEDGPTLYAQGDTFNSILSQIRQATQVWNGVSTSDLRVTFGGLENGTTPQNLPGGDVVFEDLPPGIYGYGGPTSTSAPVTTAAGTFLPIARSVVHLNRNVTLKPGPSYAESFFLTAVHEMGHALGLQHTFTSAAMSTATTRATSLSRPIDTDDIAGLSMLYPTPALSQFGSISGRITTPAGQGVHMASVVAIRASGSAVSALTNPDGSYRINGIPPGNYFVFVHALPPDADIKGPWDASGKTVPMTGATDTLFYPGTTSFVQAVPVAVKAGGVSKGIDVAVKTRPSVPLYDVSVYAFFNQNSTSDQSPIAIKPAAVSLQTSGSTVVASGAGLGSNGNAPGLGVQIMGGSLRVAQDGIRPYLSNGYTYVALDLNYALGAVPGPQHVLFTTPDYLYVLPSGITLTQNPPPSIASVSSNSDGSATVTGTNWAADSLIYFDGLPSTIRSLDPVAGTATVMPPLGASGQTSTITVYNSDGQNSQFLQANAPATYQYGSGASPSITSVAPSSLPAGTEAMVDIQATGTNFQQGVTTVGFGTSDVFVRRIFILSATHLMADVSVYGKAAIATSDVSVFTGFQIATATASFQISSALPNKPNPIPTLVNALPPLSGIYPGATVSLYGANLANGTPVLTINDQPVTLLYTSPNQFNMTLPANLTPGPAILKLFNGTDSAYPVAVNIDPAPALVAAFQNGSGAYIDQLHPAHPGDLIYISLLGFADASQTIANSRVRVNVSGTDHVPSAVSNVGSGVFQVSFLISDADPVGKSIPLIVYLDGRSSVPVAIPIARANGSFLPAADVTSTGGN